MERDTSESPHRYDDMLDMPHHVSPTRHRMSRHDRAAQFAPFAALTGFGAAIEETSRQTDRRIELSESEMAELAEKLRIIDARLGEQLTVSLTRYVPDPRKEGGRYETVSGVVRRIDREARVLTLLDGTRLDIDDIIGIDGAIFDELGM